MELDTHIVDWRGHPGRLGRRAPVLERRSRLAWRVCRVGSVAAVAFSSACDTTVNINLLPNRTQPIEVPGSSTGAYSGLLDAYVPNVPGEREASLAETDGQSTSSIGSGAADTGVPVASLLAHHYDFVGEGTLVRDLVGDAEGEVMGGAVLDASGVLELDGLDDFVDLPNGLLSSLNAATITLWVQWRGGVCWQRLFDFGSSTTSEDTSSSAETSLLVTPASCRASHLGPVEHNVLSLMFHAPGNYSIAQDVNPLSTDAPVFVVLAAGSDGGLMLSMNGQIVIQLESALRLSDLNDVNNWIGRSQWVQDPTLRAAVFDLRIYDAALTIEQVKGLFAQTASEI